MKKKIGLFIFAVLLTHIGLYAQSVYMETGFNTLGNINYSNTADIDFETERILLPQLSTELGLRHRSSDRCIISLGISNNAYNFTNNLFIPIDSTTNESIHVKSFFELGYLGGNLGLDYSLIEDDEWAVFFSGKFSGNILDRGVRTDKVMNADLSILPNMSTNLMQDPTFKKLWFNVQFGLALSYKVSDLASLNTRYYFNRSLTSIENDQESYDFNSHTFSVGLTFNIREQGKDKERLSNSSHFTNDLETKTFIGQTDSDSSSISADKFLIKDSDTLRIYFPVKSTEFYDTHTEVLEQIADQLLKDRSSRYNITGYYEGLLNKNECIVRLRSVLDFFIERGIPRQQFIIAYKDDATGNFLSRRVEMYKLK